MATPIRSRGWATANPKVEPNDLNKDMMLDLGFLSEAAKYQILALFQQYRRNVIENKSSEALINEIDKILVKIFIEEEIKCYR
jgi:hypothetical protein